MTTDIVVLRDIFERDMDLLLLEEFVSSADFCQWFLKQIHINGNFVLERAERSVITATGESDIELTFVGTDQRLMLLIENKVDAPLQVRQAARYLERADTYCESGVCNRVVTIIVAPSTYLGFAVSNDFNASITYEGLLDWFKFSSGLGPRRLYKMAVISRAIDRGSSGWQLLPNSTTTDFWQRYWKLSCALAPELCMPEPELKPRDSNFIRFRPPSVPSELSFIHQVPYGRVDIQFPAMADRRAELQKRFEKKMQKGMQIVKAAKSGAIRVRVAEIDMQAPFKDSENKVRVALRAAVSLLALYEGRD